jgi:hypothetical protein
VRHLLIFSTALWALFIAIQSAGAQSFDEPLGGPIAISGNGKLTYFPLEHPGGSIGYRLDWPERSMAYVTDTMATAEADYLAACASIVRHRPDRSRDMVRWTRRWIDTVERRSAAVDFLEGYSYDG